MPIHWSGENTSAARMGALVQGATIPIRASPRPRRRRRVSSRCRFATRLPAVAPAIAYRRSRLLGIRAHAGWSRDFFALPDAPGSWAPGRKPPCCPRATACALPDAAPGHYRVAVLREGRLEAVLFVAPGPKLPSLEWLKPSFELRHSRRRAPRAAGGPARWECRRRSDRVRLLPGRCARIAAALAGGACTPSRPVGSAERGPIAAAACPRLKPLSGARRRQARARGRQCRHARGRRRARTPAAHAPSRCCRCSLRSPASAWWSPAAARQQRGRQSCCRQPAPRRGVGPSLVPRCRRWPPRRPAAPWCWCASLVHGDSSGALAVGDAADEDEAGASPPPPARPAYRST